MSDKNKTPAQEREVYVTLHDRLIAAAVLLIGIATTMIVAFLSMPTATLFSNEWVPLLIGGSILLAMIAPMVIALNKRGASWLMIPVVIINTVGTLLCTSAFAFRYVPELNVTEALFPAACACGLTLLVLLCTLFQSNRWDNHPQLIGSIVTFVVMIASFIVWIASHKDPDQKVAVFAGFLCLSSVFLFFFTLASAYILPYPEAFLEYVTFASFGYLAVAAVIVLLMLLIISGDCDCDCDCDGGCCDSCSDGCDGCLTKPADLHDKRKK